MDGLKQEAKFFGNPGRARLVQTMIKARLGFLGKPRIECPEPKVAGYVEYERDTRRFYDMLYSDALVRQFDSLWGWRGRGPSASLFGSEIRKKIGWRGRGPSASLLESEIRKRIEQDMSEAFDHHRIQNCPARIDSLFRQGRDGEGNLAYPK